MSRSTIKLLGAKASGVPDTTFVLPDDRSDRAGTFGAFQIYCISPRGRYVACQQRVHSYIRSVPQRLTILNLTDKNKITNLDSEKRDFMW